MRILLDTHAFLWWNATRGSRLSERALDLIRSPDVDVLFSVVSAYEIGVKARLGTLELPSDPTRYVPARIARHGFRVLDLEMAHALRAAALPLLHRDPFDRLLIGQAQVEDVPILTVDPAIGRYDVEVIW